MTNLERELITTEIFLKTFKECTDKGFPFEESLKLSLEMRKIPLELGISLKELEIKELKASISEWDKKMKDESNSVSERLYYCKKILKAVVRLEELENG